jgi:hypothetical protein
MLTPHNSKDLGDVERLLSTLRPGSNDLDTDVMLFAAGVAAGRQAKGKIVLSTLCGLLAVATAGLAVWGLAERRERIQLAHHQEEHPSSGVMVRRTIEPVPNIYEPSNDDYLSLRRSMEADPNGFVAWQPVGNLRPGELPPPEAEILKSGQGTNILD